MLKHCVILKTTAGTEAAVSQAMGLLQELRTKVPGMLDFAHGPNRDFEGLSPGYSYGFVMTFADRASHLAYERHPDHVAAGGMLVASCIDGIGGIFVVDLEVAG